MEINCNHVVEKYLLNQNPVYAFSLPIAVLVAILVFGISKVFNWSNNSYVNQILIPFLAFLVIMVIIDVLSRWMITKEETEHLLKLCDIWKRSNPMLKMDIDKVINFKKEKNLEFFTNDLKNKNVNQNVNENVNENVNQNVNDVLIDPIEEMKGIHPYPLEYKKENAKCVSGSNCCSICSGTENSCKLNAPIPGPQWLPQNAEAVQNRLIHNDYTKNRCG